MVRVLRGAMSVFISVICLILLVSGFGCDEMDKSRSYPRPKPKKPSSRDLYRHFLEDGVPQIRPGEQGGVITADLLRVRDDARDNTTIVAYLDRNDTVRVRTELGFYYKGKIGSRPDAPWVQVENAVGESGWVADGYIKRFEIPARYFLRDGTPAVEPGQQGAIALRSVVDVREHHDADYRKLGYLNRGDTVRVVSKRGEPYEGYLGTELVDWIQVINTSKERGYLVSNNVQIFANPSYDFSFTPEELAQLAENQKVRRVGYVETLEGKPAPIRKRPDNKSKVICKVPSRTWLSILDRDEFETGSFTSLGQMGAWLEVLDRYERRGYILKDDVVRGVNFVRSL